MSTVPTAQTEEIITRLQQAIEKSEYKYAIRAAWLFGSAARGEMTDTSDVDVLIDLDPEAHLGLKFFALQEYMEEALGRSVDLGTPRSLHPLLREEILHSATLVYEQ